MNGLVLEARGWLLDCGCPEDLLAEQSDAEVVREIGRQYEGGWEAFVEASA